MDLMGFAGTSSAGAVTLAGTAYFIGSTGLYLAGIMEQVNFLIFYFQSQFLYLNNRALFSILIELFRFILGNTFPMIVFMTFGGFWAAYAFFLPPSQGVMAAALASSANDYSGAFAMNLGSWAFMTIVFLIASLRT